MTTTSSERPNIVLILADDMGFSDLGSYGSEVQTPNLDRLAASGLRFSQMYNSARCCPSRASLLTGLNPHQSGVGHMVNNLGPGPYQGYLNDNCATIAEVLNDSGYRTMMSGKWHVGGDYHTSDQAEWNAGGPGRPTPTQRGFDRFFGILGGAGSYFNPVSMMREEQTSHAETPEFYLTDAISDEAVQMVDESADLGDPFFLYLAYTAPHWPLHAFEEDISRYSGKYRDGWDELRTGRHEQMKGMGILDSRWDISPRVEDAPPWKNAEEKDWEDLRMAVYAAQIDRMDQGIGRVMDTIKRRGLDDNTLVMFMADNGGCAELLQEDAGAARPSVYAQPTVDGLPMRMGNDNSITPGGADTFMSYDIPWANASNAPFRLFKHWVHEGGISTPFIVSWPARIQSSGIVHSPVHFIDISATCLDAAGARYPVERNGMNITPAEGESLLSAFEGRTWERTQPIVWEHEGNRAVRDGQWKLVSEYGKGWELYDMEADRTELNDLAGSEATRVASMEKVYMEWAERCGVQQFPVGPAPAARQSPNVHVSRMGRPTQPA